MAPSGQPVAGPLQAVLEPSACQQRACPGQPSAPEGTCSWEPPSVHEGSSASGSAGPRHAKCQTTRVPAARGHQVSGERGFSQQGVKEKTRKPIGRASAPWGPGGRGENSKLFAAVHRKREGVGGGSVSSTAELWWGDSVVGYMPSSLSQTA